MYRRADAIATQHGLPADSGHLLLGYERSLAALEQMPECEIVAIAEDVAQQYRERCQQLEQHMSSHVRISCRYGRPKEPSLSLIASGLPMANEAAARLNEDALKGELTVQQLFDTARSHGLPTVVRFTQSFDGPEGEDPSWNPHVPHFVELMTPDAQFEKVPEWRREPCGLTHAVGQRIGMKSHQNMPSAVAESMQVLQLVAELERKYCRKQCVAQHTPVSLSENSRQVVAVRETSAQGCSPFQEDFNPWAVSCSSSIVVVARLESAGAFSWADTSTLDFRNVDLLALVPTARRRKARWLWEEDDAGSDETRIQQICVSSTADVVHFIITGDIAPSNRNAVVTLELESNSKVWAFRSLKAKRGSLAMKAQDGTVWLGVHESHAGASRLRMLMWGESQHTWQEAWRVPLAAPPGCRVQLQLNCPWDGSAEGLLQQLSTFDNPWTPVQRITQHGTGSFDASGHISEMRASLFGRPCLHSLPGGYITARPNDGLRLWSESWLPSAHFRAHGMLAHPSGLHLMSGAAAGGGDIVLVVGQLGDKDCSWGVDVFKIEADTITEVGCVRDDSMFGGGCDVLSCFDGRTLYVLPPEASVIVFFNMRNLLSRFASLGSSEGTLPVEVDSRDYELRVGASSALVLHFSFSHPMEEESKVDQGIDDSEDSEGDEGSDDSGESEDSEGNYSPRMPNEAAGLRTIEVHGLRKMEVEMLWHFGEGLGGGGRIRAMGYSDYFTAWGRSLGVTRQQMIELTATNAGDLGFWRQFLQESDLKEIDAARRLARLKQCRRRFRGVVQAVRAFLLLQQRAACRVHAPGGLGYKRSRASFERHQRGGAPQM